MTRGVVMVFALSLVGACAHTGADGSRVLPKAKPAALEAFRDGARLVRLGPGSYERALDRLRAAVETDDKLWEAWYDIGWIERDRHRYAEALTALERAVAIQPGHAGSVVALVDTYVRAGRYDDAIRVAKAALDAAQKRPDTARAELSPVRIALAQAQRRAGKLDDATESLRQVLRLEARSPDALAGLGQVYFARKQYELAELVMRRALEIREKAGQTRAAAELWNNLGLIALTERRDQEAFADFDKATQLDPASTVARRNKALVYLDCGDYARASEELKRATHDDPEDVDAWTALGVAERGLGHVAEAERAYSRALAIDPNAPDALFNLGILNAEWKKDSAHATEYFTHFLEVAESKHPHKKDAEERLKDLAPKAPKAAQ